MTGAGLGALLGGLAVVGGAAAVAARPRRARGGGLGAPTVALKLKGQLRCFIPGDRHRGGSQHEEHREVPGTVELRCDEAKGECKASFTDCKYTGEVFKKTVTKLLPQPTLSRGRDNSGGWNASLHWRSERSEYDDRGKQEYRDFELQTWDAAPGDPVWAHGIDLERAYPRGPMNFEHETARFTLDAESRERLRSAYATVPASEVMRHGSISPEELRAAPKPWWER